MPRLSLVVNDAESRDERGAGKCGNKPASMRQVEEQLSRPGSCRGSGLLKKAKKVVKQAAHVTIDVVAAVPYTEYYVSYQAAKAIDDVGAKAGPVGSAVAHVVAAPLALPEAHGLAADAAIDVIKHESVRDEQVRGYVNPVHSFVPSWLRGPQTYLPGIGKRGVDFKW